MELYQLLQDEIKNNKPKTNLSSLIKNLSQISFFELSEIINLFDNPKTLQTEHTKWFPIHYAAMNKDFRILETFLQLHEKHNISKNLFINKSKEAIPELSSVLDISYCNKRLSHVIIAKKYNVTSLLINNNIPNTMYHYKNYNDKLDVINVEQLQANIHINKKLPFADNLLTPAIFIGRHFADEMIYLDSKNFSNKAQLFLEFQQNVESILNFAIAHTPTMYERFSDSIINTGKELIRKDRKDIFDTYFELFCFPFFKQFDFSLAQFEKIFRFQNWEYLYENNSFSDMMINSKLPSISQRLGQAKKTLHEISQKYNVKDKDIDSLNEVLQKSHASMMFQELNSKIAINSTSSNHKVNKI